ncbi:uncharacterized protein LOC116939071 [Petromyzon marinus]|uniref:uncharacterized protein LOC116939071 n=1 Tax=Petromyzon marinus TaxID=7757 RepID=UPI003F6F3DED
MNRTFSSRMMTSSRTQHWLPGEKGGVPESDSRRSSLQRTLQLAKQLQAMGTQLIPVFGSSEEVEAGDWAHHLRAAGVPLLSHRRSFFPWAQSHQKRLLRDAGALAFFLDYLRRLLTERAQRQPEQRSTLASLRGTVRSLEALLERLCSALRPAGQPPRQMQLQLLHAPSHGEQGKDAADKEEDEEEEEEEEEKQLKCALRIPALVMLHEFQAWVERTVRDLNTACKNHHEMV